MERIDDYSTLESIKTEYIENLKDTKDKVGHLNEVAKQYKERSEQLSQVQESLTQARLAYKKVEFLLSYRDPELTTKYINGAPLPKLEKHVPEISIIPPNGLQTLDELIFLSADEDIDEIIKLSKDLYHTLEKTIKYQSAKPLQHRYIIESIRYGIVGVMSLGLTGFDTPGSGNAIPEALASFKTMKKTIQYYKPDEKDHQEVIASLLFLLEGGIQYLKDNNDFDTFNRIDFIKSYINPLYSTIYNWHKVSQVEFSSEVDPTLSAHNYESQSIFDLDFLNAPYYTGIASEDLFDEKKIELGKLLFYDPVLSKDLKMSCASCHQPNKGFADGSAKSLGNDEVSLTERHSPSLINSAYYGNYFWDMREYDLERQVKHVIMHSKEFNTDFIELAELLKTSDEYVQLFEDAYQGRDKYTISTWSISNALAAYVTSLSSWDSSFDQYMRNEIDDYPEEAKAGFNLFMGKAACGTCHFAPSFSGIVPPFYQDSESEVLGITMGLDTLNPVLDNDMGRAANGLAEEQVDHYQRSMKTVTVRNAGITAPYMHNGSFRNLEEVMHFYNKGGGAGMGLDVPYQTLPDTHLGLSDKEMQEVISFMETLTDTIGLTSTPSRLPKFQDRPEWNERILY
jgi:cytochrome c peroxidase